MFPAVTGREGRSSAHRVVPPRGADDRDSGGGGADDAERIPVRPLSWRELADLPFAMLQHRIRLIAGLAGAGSAVALGIVAGITALVSFATDDSSAGTAWAAIVSTACCAWVLRLWTVGVTVPIGLAVVDDQPITARTAAERLFPVSGRLLLNQVISTSIGFGILLLGTPLIVTLIPAVIWLARVRGTRWPIAPVLFTESIPYQAAVRRAKLLATGRVMPLAGLWLYLRAVLLVLAAPVAGLLGFLSDISGTHRWAVVVLLSGAVLLVSAFAAAVDAATAVVVHIDRRCGREGFDIRIPSGQATR